MSSGDSGDNRVLSEQAALLKSGWDGWTKV